MDKLLEAIKEWPSSTVSDFEYDKEGKLESKKTKDGNDIFVETKTEYNEDGKPTKIISEAYFGEGMRKKHISTTTSTFTYEETDEFNTIHNESIFNDLQNNKTITNTIQDRKFDHESGIILEEKIVGYNDDGNPASLSITEFKDGKAISEVHKIIRKDAEDIVVNEKKFDNETGRFIIHEYDKDGKPLRMVSSKPSKIIVADGIEDYNDQDIEDYISGTSTSVKFVKDVARPDTVGREIVTHPFNGSIQDFYKSLELYRKFNDKTGYIKIHAESTFSKKGMPPQKISSIDDLQKNKGLSIVILPNSVLVSAIENRTTIQLEREPSPFGSLVNHITYNFDEDDIHVTLDYMNGVFINGSGIITIDDKKYCIDLGGIQRIAKAIVVVKDKEGHILSEYKTGIDTENKSQMDIFYNLFNLLVKNIKEKYGNDSIQFEDQDKVILLKDKTFNSLLARFEIMRR